MVGTCAVGGMHGGRACVVGGHAWWGACMARGGGMRGRKMAIAVGSMHPTGMHSCYNDSFSLIDFVTF